MLFVFGTSAGFITTWLLSIIGLLGAEVDMVAVDVTVVVDVVTGAMMMGLTGVGSVTGAGADFGAGASSSSGSPRYSSPFNPLSIMASLVLCVRSTLGFLAASMEFCCLGFTN